MKRSPIIFLSVLLCIVLLYSFALHGLAHSGGTDQNGGHTDSDTGKYHYHHGYPAHQHYDIDGNGTVDCPYKFHDKTGQNSGSNTQTPSTKPASQAEKNATTSQSSTTKNQNSGANKWSDTAKEFLRTLFGRKESTLAVIGWIFVIVPAGIYTTRSYKPKDILGYFSKAVLIIVCAALVLSSPLSIALYALYCYIYRHITRHKAASKAKSSDNQPMPPLPAAPKHAENVTRPVVEDSTERRICEGMWRSVDCFRSACNIDPALAFDTYLWTALFYAITKQLRNQNAVNKIYSHFGLAARQEIRHFTVPSATPLIQQMREYYAEFAIVLNDSGIDPCTEEGISQLWALLLTWSKEHGISLPEDPTAFRSTVLLTKSFTLTLSNHSQNQDSSRQYSLSADNIPETNLPL